MGQERHPPSKSVVFMPGDQPDLLASSAAGSSSAALKPSSRKRKGKEEVFGVGCGWRVSVQGGSFRCVHERSGQVFVDVFQHNWTLTTLSLFQRLGAFFERMLRFSEQRGAGRWDGDVEWAVEEHSAGSFTATWARTQQRVCWHESQPQQLFWRYHDSCLCALAALADGVADTFYANPPGLDGVDTLVARARFGDWCQHEDYSYPVVRGWARLRIGTSTTSHRFWLSADRLCPCFVGYRKHEPPRSCEFASHDDLVGELDMSELQDVVVRRVVQRGMLRGVVCRMLHPILAALASSSTGSAAPSSSTALGTGSSSSAEAAGTGSAAERFEFVMRFNTQPEVVCLVVHSADDAHVWRVALERCLWVNRASKKLRDAQHQRMQQRQQQRQQQHPHQPLLV